MKSTLALGFLTLALAAAATAPAHAADTSPSPAPMPAPTAPKAPTAATPTGGYSGGGEVLSTARAHNLAGRYGAAITELKRVNATTDADWNNLMGFALRKNSPPDLDAAQRHYDAALTINPNHLGALEYSGELALMKRDLPTAEGKLAKIETLCKSPCEALDMLKASIAKFKATR
jgi:tetratricopeptide (TPR) repeat protein